VKLFRRRGGKCGWEYTAHGFLWRVCPAPGARLIGEERDVERRQASYFCLSLSGGVPLWKDRNFGESWWIGIDIVFRDILVLHRFMSPDIPEPMGITVVDLETGGVLWEKSDAVFAGVAGDDLVVRPKGRGPVEAAVVDRRSGDPLPPTESSRNVSTVQPEEWEREWIFPVVLPAGDPLQDIVNARGAAGEVLRSCIETGRLTVVGYHVRSSGSQGEPVYDSMIALVDTASGRTERELKMEKEVRRPMPDTFLVRGEMLYCIRDRRVLAAVPLTE
jgi:hypothetical protein